MLEIRLKKIQQYLYSHGTATVQDLADHTGASVATIRRDLVKMEEEGLISRTYGGATLTSENGVEIAFQVREHQYLKEKRAIAEAAYAHLKSGMTVFLDAGTTVLQMARIIKMQPLPLFVITNGISVAQELIGVSEVKVMLLGGQIRPENLSNVGPYAERMLENFWFDLLFLGTSAVRLDHGLFTLDAAEASLNFKMLERAGEKVLLADSSKFNRSAPYRVAELSALSRIITDHHLPDDLARRITDQGVALERASSTVPQVGDLG